MINLWLDDVRPAATTGYFKGREPALQWHWVKTVPEAIALVEKHGIANIEFMSLDHDLGWCEACEKKRLEDTGTLVGYRAESIELIRPPDKSSTNYWSCRHFGDGTQFVEWLRDTGNWPATKPVVHSWNPDGARRMRAIIDAHYDTEG